MDILSEIQVIDEAAMSNDIVYSLPASSDSTIKEITQGRQIQQLNLAAMVMERMPIVLREMSYNALIEAYQRMYDIQTIQWKCSCAILTEAYFRVSSSTPHGTKQQVLKIIAQDFGINIKRLYQKVQLWLVFWQDASIKDKVIPNKNSWVFEQFAHGEAYFREALTAPDPITTILEAEKKYLEAIKSGSTYTIKQFKIDLSLTHKDENGRLQQISRKISDLAETATSLITEEDTSYSHVQEFSNKLKQIADGLSNVSLASTKENGILPMDLYQKGLEKLSYLLEESVIQVQSLVSVGLDVIEPIEDTLISLWEKVKSLKESHERRDNNE